MSHSGAMRILSRQQSGLPDVMAQACGIQPKTTVNLLKVIMEYVYYVDSL